MGRTIVIHQPDFLPHLAFFHRLYLADVFIILDHVQHVKNGWHNRDKIKTSSGVEWLTIPVVRSGRSKQSLLDVNVSTTLNWRTKHMKTLEYAYSSSPYFHDIFPGITSIYEKKTDKLVDINMEFILYFINYFDIKVEIFSSSELCPEFQSNELLIDLIRKVNGKTYISGIGARSYMDEALWTTSGIELIWQQYEERPYPQLKGEFSPGLSCIDFAMNCGPHLKEFLFHDAP